ncbi:hypothetical protein BGZ65_005038, partial [Modicella reniformis]
QQRHISTRIDDVEPTGTEGTDSYEQESSDVSGSVYLNTYIPWLMEHESSESVSFTSFVEKFWFVDLEDAKAVYETLINSSRLRLGRQRKLQATYQLFLRNKLQSFWSSHLLKMEKRETKTNLRIAVTKSARVVQTASVREIANTANSCLLTSTPFITALLAGNKRPHDGSLIGQDTSPSRTPKTAHPASSLDSRPARSTYILIAESVHVGQKHPRDCSDDDNAVQTKPPWNRAPPMPKECSEYKERENAWSDNNGDDNEGLLDTGPPVRPTSFDKAEDAVLPDARTSVRPALFDQVEDATSDDSEVVPPDLPVQPALNNQVEVTPSRTSLKVTLAEDLYGQHASGISTGTNHRQLKRREYTVNEPEFLFDDRHLYILCLAFLIVSFGRSLTIDDFHPPGYSSSDGSRDNQLQATVPTCPKLIDADLSSSDPGDSSFSSSQGLYESTSRVYTWNYLVGNGRPDSNVSSAWRYNDVDISRDLMDFRDRVIQENSGLNHPHQKLAVNFVFLFEGDHRTKGLHMEIDDKPWAALCEATRDHADRLPKETVDEALQWVQFLMRESPDAWKSRLRSTPPNDLSLQSILNLMAVSGHLWDSEPSNEDSFLKSWLGPFLSTYFGSITFTTSAWTHTQEETRKLDFSRLVPDFATVTATLQGELSLVLLEGKVAENKGQEMKLALDSILVLSPGDDVCVVGILVTEPLVEFFSMKIHAEGCYVMQRFAICHIATDHENMFSLISVMEAFHHAATKVIKTLAAIRQVR